VGSVACGLSGAVVVFSAANAVLWRPLPAVEAPDRMVRLFRGERGVWSYPDYVDVGGAVPALRSSTAFATSPVPVAVPPQEPREVLGQQISDGYFEVLGARLAMGRSFRAEDGDAVAVLGHGYWKRALGGDRDVLGQTVEIQGRPHAVIGVAPPGLTAVAAPALPDVYYPIPRQQREDRDWGSLDVLGRLAEGASVEQAQAQASVAATRLPERPGEPGSPRETRGVAVYAERDARVPLGDRAALLGAVGLALALTALIVLIVCANLANLVLTRGLARRREVGVRLALGASRRRLVAQLATESAVLAVLAGGLALGLVHALTAWLASRPLVASLPAALDLQVDGAVVGFVLAATAVAGLAFGLVPALHATRRDLVSVIGGGLLATRSRFGLRRLLVTAQIAGSLLLVVASLQIARALETLHRVPLGFDPDRVVVLPIDTAGRHGGPEATAEFFERVRHRLEATPGVQAVAFAQALPLGGTRIGEVGTEIEGYEPPPGRPTALSMNVVSPGYFDLAGIALMAGRGFDATDVPGAPEVVVVDEAFVDAFWPEGRALGRRVGEATVVGVVRSTRYRSLTGSERPMVWRCLAQRPADRLVVHALAAADPEALLRGVESAVADLDPRLLLRAATWRDRIGESLLLPRLLASNLGAAGLLAVGLAALGIYGVMAFAGGLRTREMGVRLALGASPRRLLVQVVGEGVALSSIGLGSGLVLSVGATLALGAMIPGFGRDPVPATLAGLVLGAVAAAASLLAARRAAAIDPVRSLRRE
jgi:predicted permease